MGLLTKLREWANNTLGIANPGNSKVDIGWVNNEQPPHEWENWSQNRQDVLLNELAEINNRKTEPPYFSTPEDNCAGVPQLNEIHYPYNSGNVHDVGTGIDIEASCRGYNHELGLETVLVADVNDNTKIYEIYNDEDFGIQQIEHTVTIPTGFNIKSMACDGEHVYCAVSDGVASRVLKFDINPWTAAPIWTRTLTGVGQIFGPAQYHTRIIIANDTYIACFTGATMSNNPVVIIAKDNSTITYGAGNNGGTYTTETLKHGFCTDGIRVWFVLQSSADSKFYILNALISNPTTGTGSPLKLADDTNFTGCSLWADNKNVFVGAIYFDTLTPLYYITLGIYNIQSGYWRPLVYRIDDASLINDPSFHDFCFDGRRLWTRFAHKPITNETINEGQECIVPFHPANMEYWSNAPVPKTIDPIRVFLHDINAGLAPTATEHGGTIYADGCIWCMQRNDSSIVIRVPAISTFN